MDEGTHFVKVLNGVALAGCCSIDALSPGVFASLDPRLSAGNLSGCRFPAGPRWFRRPTTYGTRRMKFFARRANINCLHCGYPRMCKLTLVDATLLGLNGRRHSHPG